MGPGFPWQHVTPVSRCDMFYLYLLVWVNSYEGKNNYSTSSKVSYGIFELIKNLPQSEILLPQSKIIIGKCNMIPHF
jgi:hypothetical protein